MKTAQRTKAAWGDLAVVLIVLLAAVVLSIYALPRSEQSPNVQVVLDGEVILACSLEEFEEGRRMDIGGEYPLTLEFSRDGVQVVRAECPGEDCRHIGTVSRVGEQIICLPNRLVVTLQGEAPSYDAVTG